MEIESELGLGVDAILHGHLDELRVLIVEYKGRFEEVTVGVELLAAVGEGVPDVPAAVDIGMVAVEDGVAPRGVEVAHVFTVRVGRVPNKDMDRGVRATLERALGGARS